MIRNALYSAEFIDEINSSLPVYYYPGASREGGKEGLLVKVVPDVGKPWIGVFSAYGPVRQGTGKLYAMPEAGKLCIVVSGCGYIVDAVDPTIWEDLAATYVTDVRELPDLELILFADWTRLVAYGKTGKQWKTNDVALDGFEIIDIVGDRLTGKYEGMGGEENVFEVHLKSGEVKGGFDSRFRQRR